MLILHIAQRLAPPLNDVFQARPDEIRALRRALNWSPERLGQALNLDLKRGASATIANWENGLERPDRDQAARLVQLVNVHREEYLRALRV